MKNNVLITGATSGIGKEFAKIYAQRNYNLILISRNISKLENLKKELNLNNDISIDIFAVDLSEYDSSKLNSYPAASTTSLIPWTAAGAKGFSVAIKTLVILFIY